MKMTVRGAGSVLLCNDGNQQGADGWDSCVSLLKGQNWPTSSSWWSFYQLAVMANLTDSHPFEAGGHQISPACGQG